MPRFFYTGIHVSDLDRSIDFYTKELGMKLLFRGPIEETGGAVAWLRSKRSKQLLELNWYPEGYKYGGKSGLDHLAFEVDDLDESYSALTKSRKGEIEPFLEGRWKLGYVTDPDGNWIELGQRLKQQPKKKRKSSA